MSDTTLEERNLQRLRQRAEAAIERKPTARDALDKLSTEEIHRLIHELDVYRVELEMQNEELRRTQDELEELLDRYTDLYDYAPVGYLIVQSYGIITSANVTAANLLLENRKDLEGTSVQSFIDREYQDAFFKLRRSAEKEAGVQSCMVVMRRKGDLPFHARMDCIAIPGEGSSTAFRVSFIEHPAPPTQ
ncbi:MAG: PAS domain-containing protein [Gammaproteobacteria bacterium]|nr:PAS domain-containing protein [Gammaproteobacteria bacterium]